MGLTQDIKTSEIHKVLRWYVMGMAYTLPCINNVI